MKNLKLILRLLLCYIALVSAAYIVYLMSMSGIMIPNYSNGFIYGIVLDTVWRMIFPLLSIGYSILVYKTLKNTLRKHLWVIMNAVSEIIISSVVALLIFDIEEPPLTIFLVALIILSAVAGTLSVILALILFKRKQSRLLIPEPAREKVKIDQPKRYLRFLGRLVKLFLCYIALVFAIAIVYFIFESLPDNHSSSYVYVFIFEVLRGMIIPLLLVGYSLFVYLTIRGGSKAYLKALLNGLTAILLTFGVFVMISDIPVKLSFTSYFIAICNPICLVSVLLVSIFLKLKPGETRFEISTYFKGAKLNENY